jgi:hypothetical protein
MKNDKKGKRFRQDTPSNPFDTYNTNFKSNLQQPFSVFNASPVAGAEDQQKRQEDSNVKPIAVSFPPHLYIPEDAQSIDISELDNVPPGDTVTLLSMTGLKGGFVYFTGYAVFNDALMLSLIELVPKVNGSRVLSLHGNPQLKFKMGLGLGPDLSTLIPCQLMLQPNDVLTWEFTNNDVVDVAAGVRMSGYFSQSTIRKSGRFGG